MYDVTKTPNYEKALAWVNGINANRWKLLTMRIRSRNPATKDGVVEKPRPIIIQRFVSGCPKECLREVIEILNVTSPYKEVVVDNHKYEGPFRSSLMIWERDAQAVTDRGDATMTLKQTLILALTPDDFDSIVKMNCSGTTEARYVWDASEVEALPATAEPGVTYQIAGVSRDDATGLFSYYVLKTTANQIYVQYEAAENFFEVVVKDEYTNLMPDQFDPSIAGYTPPGTLVEVDAKKNEDCTLNVVKATTTATPRSNVVVVTTDDVYKAIREISNVAQPSALGEAPAPVAGLVLTHTSQVRKDALFDTKINATQEHEVDNARVEVSVGVEATIVEVTDIKPVPLDTPTEVGVRATNERTPGNLFKRTLYRVLAALRAKIKEAFTADLFKSGYSKTSIEATEATDPGFSGGGLTKEATSELTEGGKWRVTRSQNQEKEVPEAAVTVEATLNGVVREEVSIAATPLTYPGATEIGERASNKKTPGGWFERTRRYLVRVLLPRIAQEYTEDQFSATVAETNVEPVRPENETMFTPGQIKKTDSAMTETGAFRVRRSTEVATPVLDSGVTVSEDLLEQVVMDAGVHQNTLPDASFVGNVVRSLGQWARNPFGRFEYRRTITTPKNAVQEEVKSEDTALSSTKVSAEWNRSTKPDDVGIQGEGTYSAVITAVDPKKNRFGLFDAVTQKVYPKKKVDKHSFAVGDYYFWYAYFKNLTRSDLTLLLSEANTLASQFQAAAVSPSFNHNLFGLIDGVISVTYRNDNNAGSSGYAIFSDSGLVYGPYIYNWNKDEGTGNLVYQRIRYKYHCYYQQGHDYAHGMQDYMNYKDQPPNVELGSHIDRLGSNWYFFFKVYGDPVGDANWETLTTGA